MTRLKKHLYAIVVLLLLWSIISWRLNTVVVPTPAATFNELREILFTKLLPNLWVSYKRLLLAILISTALGSVIGIGVGLSKRLANVVMPVIQFIYPIPRAAFLPMFLIFFGLKDASKVAFMVAVSVFYFIIPFYDTVRNLPQQYHIIAKTLNLSRIQWIWHVILPACASEYFTATKMTVGTSMATLFFAENISGSSGIAYFIMSTWGFSNYPAMYAGIVLVSLAGVLVFTLLEIIEEKVTAWKQ